MSRSVRNLRLFGELKPSNPSHTVGEKIRKLVKEEGRPQDQAVAIALDMERRGELKRAK